MANVGADNAFWPPLPGISDLTLKFEETVLELTPSSLIIALSPVVIAQNLQQPVRVRRSPLLWIKLLVAVALVGLEIAALAFRAVHHSFLTETTLAAASMDLAAAVAVTAVLYVEHCHAIRSSALLGVYFLVAAVFDAVKCRSFFSRPGLAPVGALAAAACGVKILLLVLQEVDKRNVFIDPALPEALGEESTTGYWKRMFFTFLNPMLLAGFRKVLKLEDLSNIGPDFSSRVLHATLKRRLEGVHWGSKNALMRICFQSWMWLFLLVLIPRLCFTGFSFSQPFILRRAIEIVAENDVTNGERGFLLFATFISFTGSTLSKIATAHMSYRLVTRLRGALVSLISEKNARLPQSEAKKSAAVTLMSTDVDGIASGLPQVYELVMTLLEVGVGVYALSRFVGYAAFAVIAPLVASTVAAYLLGDWVGPAFALWNKSIEMRVSKTSKVLGQLKAIKMFGLGPTIGDYLQRLRQTEMAVSKKFRALQAAASIPVICAELITPLAVIAAALFGNTFNGRMSAGNVFPALSIIVLVKNPLAMLLNAYPTLTSMAGCFRRIQEFLQLPEREDPRTLRESADVAPLDEKADPADPATWPLVEFVRASIAPLGTKVPILRNVSFSLKRGSLTVALGPNGAGKSFLLQSILGETSLVDGAIYITNLFMGFCGQQLWLRNISIKQNIIGYMPYDEKLFRRVVSCCLLEEDFAILPDGEDYNVGSGGSKLSGGQRQRVALARALFARMSIILLDDIFSSLDHKTASSILLRLCGEDGLLKELNTAVVLSSYLPECLDVADQLLILNGKGSVSVEKNFRSGASRQRVLQKIKASNIPKFEERPAEEEEQPSDSQVPTAATERPDLDAMFKGDLSLYWLVIDPIGKLRLGLWCFATFLCSAGEIFPDIYMRIWIERHPGENAYFAGYASIAVVTCLLFFLNCVVLFCYLMPRVALELHHHMVRTLMRATLGYLGVTDNGVIVNRFSQDMSLIARTLPVSFMRTFYVFFTAVIQCDVVVSGAVYMMRALDLETKSPLFTHFEETAEGILYIRAFGGQKMTLEEGYHLLDDSQKAFYYMYCIQQWLGLVLGLLVAVMATILMTFVLFMRGSTSQTAIGLAFLNLIYLAQTLEQLVLSWTSLETTVCALARLRDFMDKTPQEPNEGDAEVPENWPSVGNVELQDLSSWYSGKSSILLALLGFLKCTGKIIIDGVDISSIPLDILRARIVTISQDQIKLDDTVRTNLLPFTLNEDKDKMSEQQKQAAKEKDVKLEELLARLGIWSQLSDKGGLDAMLTDVGYSHGEMQLFCLARGVMRHKDTGSKVVLIDEATSSVEEEREKVAQELMRESFPGCTILVVGHRQSSITGVDATVELAKGEILRVVKNGPQSGGWSQSD